MTGTLVRIGQRLAMAISGGDRWGWLPWLGLWAALVSGGVAGAVSYLHLGLGGLWIAAGTALLLAVAARPEPVHGAGLPKSGS
jgi:uncharacterized membrane protein YoaK (UPF0700 family)